MVLNKAEELVLIEKAKQGDERAFEKLYLSVKPRIHSVCCRMAGNVTDAEDLAQETFIQVHQKLHTFKGRSRFFTWAYRIVVNFALMHRRKKASPLLPMEEAFHQKEPDRIVGHNDPALQFAAERCTLTKAIAELPLGYRRIFILHEVEGYEHNEIATLLGCTVGNSKSQLHKAKIKLHSILDPEFQPAE